MNKYLIIFLSFIGILCTTSCSESDGEEDEYANWQSRNEQYFNQVLKDAQSKVNAKDPNWKVIDTYTKETAAITSKDKIVVQVLSKGEGTESPKNVDSVLVHYRGTLMPTTEHPEGYQFDSSWSGKYNPSTMLPYKSTGASWIDGFTTAILNMHEGDRWRICIPADLAYGSSSTGSIPAYSTLTFDVTLVKIWKPGTVMPKYQ